jgi:hypothetical protein
LEDQTLQAHCNTLVVNACILSTTGYLQDAITSRGGASDAAIALLSPAHFEAINPYGDMRFDVAAILADNQPPTPPPSLTRLSRSLHRRFGSVTQLTRTRRSRRAASIRSLIGPRPACQPRSGNWTP